MGCRLWGHTESDTTEVTCSSSSRGKRQNFKGEKSIYRVMDHQMFGKKMFAMPGRNNGKQRRL